MKSKTLKLWQMIVILVVTLVLLATLFLPAFHINGRSEQKLVNEISGMIGSDMTESLFGDTEVDVQEEDESIQEIEEEYGIKLRNISPGRIMTHSLTSLMGGEDSNMMELFENVGSGYTMIRIFLWMIYGLAFFVILMVVLGFVLKISKYLPLAISAGYGLIAAIAFGIFQFVSPGLLAKSIDVSQLFNGDSLAIVESLFAGILKRMLACFWGSAFLVGFIFALLLLILSVVSMFTGSEKDGGGNKVSSEIIRQLEEKIRIQNEELRQQNQEIQRLQEVARQREAEINNLRRELSQGGNQRGFGGYSQPAMGKVVCTKGVAKGTGLSLPEDKKVVVGKNPQSSNLVINNPKVSNIHCSVRYVPASNTYIVKDHSKNGTYINGQRLQNGVPITLHAGTVLSLADGSDEITLG